jgi:hypothetical protein
MTNEAPDTPGLFAAFAHHFAAKDNISGKKPESERAAVLP